MATLNLVASSRVYARNGRCECFIFNTNIARPIDDDAAREPFAIAIGGYPNQARDRARQIVAACDGAEA